MLRRSKWVAAVCAAVVAAAVVVALPNGPAEAQPVSRARTTAVADDGARVAEEIRVDERTLDLRITSPALGTSGWVRLLLPRGWDTQTRTWPVLYLLHGAGEVEDYKSWTAFTDAAAFTADKDVLMVLPSDGKAGMYSAWWNFGGSNKPDWETFHVTEIRQLLERGYAAGTVRAVAGLSIGGYGAMAYAFRHPGMFKAAASYSGVLNTTIYGIPNFIQMILMREGLNFYSLWGNEFMQRSIWTAHNPYDNVEKLRGTRLYVSSGDGGTGPLDPPGNSPDVMIEPLAKLSSSTFTDRLKRAGIPVTTNFYGGGSHIWPYWQREFKASWPVLAASLGLPA
ncbi:alpha/beta hydrolase [Actinokineospora sp.]|uniref:alpha/beta hydrolase n=1 Tax=Actinokineospora sp. TaxID=1872133 RepID=UPI003D6ACF2B